MLPFNPIVLHRHTDTIRSLAFSPNGLLLASLSIHNDKRIILWNTVNWTPMHEFYSGSGTTMIWFTPDSKTLIGTGVNKEIVFWDVLTRVEQIRPTPSINGYVRFSPSQNAYLLYCQKQALIFYDLGTQLFQKQVSLPRSHSIIFGHCGWINADASLCAVEDADHSILLWDIDQMDLQSTLIYHQSHIMDIDFYHNEMLLASASDDGTVAIWDIHQRQLVQTFQTNAPNVMALAFHPKDPILSVMNSEEYVELWNIEKKTVLRKLEGHGGQITMAFSPDGKFFVTGSDDSTITVWQL